MASKTTRDYEGYVGVKYMRQAFKTLGPIWNDIGKKGTDLNYMLSSLLFRHRADPDYSA